MSINSLASSAASQLTYTSRVSGTSSTSGSQQVRQAPPPRDDGGGLVSAIADALKSIGVDGTDDPASTASTDGTSTDAAATTGNAAQALGSFLENLMGALHAQNVGGDEGTPPPYGEPPQGGPGMSGGPGKLSSDLQSLIAKLGDAGGTEAGESTEAATTDTTDASVGALQSSFKDLLGALGSDSGDAATQLSSFLQSLSGRLPAAGSSGNLINTSA